MCPEAEITEEAGVVIVCFGLPGILSPIFWTQYSNSLMRNHPSLLHAVLLGLFVVPCLRQLLNSWVCDYEISS